MRLKAGHTYDFKYDNFHVDPSPHLYVIWSDHKYTHGFNLHYLAMSRLKLDTKNYKRISPKVWNFIYEGMKKDSYYAEMIEIMNAIATKSKTKKEYQQGRMILEKRYPFIMRTYRTYLNVYIIEVIDNGEGVL